MATALGPLHINQIWGTLSVCYAQWTSGKASAFDLCSGLWQRRIVRAGFRPICGKLVKNIQHVLPLPQLSKGPLKIYSLWLHFYHCFGSPVPKPTCKEMIKLYSCLCFEIALVRVQEVFSCSSKFPCSLILIYFHQWPAPAVKFVCNWSCNDCWGDVRAELNLSQT